MICIIVILSSCLLASIPEATINIMESKNDKKYERIINTMILTRGIIRLIIDTYTHILFLVVFSSLLNFKFKDNQKLNNINKFMIALTITLFVMLSIHKLFFWSFYRSSLY